MHHSLPPAQPQPELEGAPTEIRMPRARRRSRTSVLLGAAALGAIAAAGVVEGLVLPPYNQAVAQTAATPSQTAVQPSFADIVAKVKPAVVSVRVKVAEDQPTGAGGMSMEEFGLEPGSPMERFFRRFQQDGGMGGPRQRQGMDEDQDQGPRGRPSPRRFGEAQGSGFFISKDGYIVTNNHVVEKGMNVEVITDDGRTLKAKVVGTDPKTDLALLKTVENGPYPTVSFGAAMPRIGDWVIAVGNPFGLGGTVTAGIVSARGRDIGAGPYDDFIQIDAPVNRGNSGGPTFNLAGEVVGINTAIASPSGGSVGIAFAIPSETAQKVVADIRDHGGVHRGFLGVQIQPVTADIADGLGLSKPEGALVAKVDPDTPAGRAGVKTGDAITALNGKGVKDARELSREVAGLEPGSTVTLSVWRDGKSQELSVKLGKLPGEKTASRSDDKGADVGKLGLSLAPADSVGGAAAKGVVVVGVEPGSPAEEKGLKPGDVIAEVAGKAVETPQDVKSAIAQSRKDGKKAVLMRLESQKGSRFLAIQVPTA
jgi:serine protease Do